MFNFTTQLKISNLYHLNQKETVKLPTIESLGIFQHESLTLHNETKEEDLVVKDEDFYSFDFKPYVT